MFEQHDAGVAASSVVGRFAEVVDELIGLDRVMLNVDELIRIVRGVERQCRRLAVVDHALIAELDERHVAAETGCASTAVLLAQLLRLSPAEAKARVAAAADLGPRRSVTGERLPSLFLRVAQAAGAIAASHARVIIRAIANLPAKVEREHGAVVEATLVDHAASLDPDRLSVLARRIGDTLDPDGTLATERDHERCRSATLRANRNGSGYLEAHLTPEALASVRAAIDALSAPMPAADGNRDPRTPAQRTHDALHEAAERLLRSDDLPTSGGTPATVLLTMTLDQLESRTGMITTAHGGQLSVDAALRIAGEANVIPIVVDKTGVLAFGQSRRIASTGQALALAARDGGCSFPGCDRPPNWCQRHHVIAWQDGGRTDVDNLTLLCGHHHRQFEKCGWRVIMSEGRPYWIPPSWLDPDRKPIPPRASDLVTV